MLTIINKTKIAHKIYIYQKLKQNKLGFLKYEFVTKNTRDYRNQLPSIVINMQIILKYLLFKISC